MQDVRPSRGISREDMRNYYTPRGSQPVAVAPPTQPAAAPKQRQAKQGRHVRKLVYISVGVLVTLLISAGVFLLFVPKDANPFSSDIRKSANFTLYYPAQLPAGYSIDKASVRQENGIVFYTLQNGSKRINISEQAAPESPPDFSLLQKAYASYKAIDVVGGKAIYILSQNLPTAIMLTNTTMVNISGSQNTPADVIVKLTQSMQPEA